MASLNHGLERKLSDSNPWFAMMTTTDKNLLLGYQWSDLTLWTICFSIIHIISQAQIVRNCEKKIEHLTLLAQKSFPSGLTSSQAFSCCYVTVVWFTTRGTAVVFTAISIRTISAFCKYHIIMSFRVISVFVVLLIFNDYRIIRNQNSFMFHIIKGQPCTDHLTKYQSFSVGHARTAISFCAHISDSLTSATQLGTF